MKQKRHKNQNKRFYILIGIIVIAFTILFIDLFYIQVVKYDQYFNLYQKASENIIEGTTAPRGRIYDRNHKLIVDNTPTKVIFYKKNKLTTDEEIKLAYKLANLLEIDASRLTDNMKRTFWAKMNHDRAQSKITESELIDLQYRKITGTDIEKRKLERITEEELKELTETDQKAAYIYYLMNKGYSYSEKVIKDTNVTDEEYNKILNVMNKQCNHQDGGWDAQGADNC